VAIRNYYLLQGFYERLIEPCSQSSKDLVWWFWRRPLQTCYVQAGKLDRVDVDQDHHHDNELTSIAERKGMMVLFRLDRDWCYRSDERRWQPMNTTKDGWYTVELHKGAPVEKPLHIQ
jgi:hypothetical protein